MVAAAFEHQALPEHWTRFISRAGLPAPARATRDHQLLRSLVRAFSRVPYENATQLLAVNEGRPAPRRPSQLIRQYLLQGTGGTCYDLSFALAELLGAYGFVTHLHRGWVGDGRRRGSTSHVKIGNHAALTVQLGRQKLLCDPGMIFQVPVPIGSTPRMDEEARETAVLTEIESDGLVHVMLRGHRGFSELCSVDLTPLSDIEIDEMWSASFAPIIPAEYLFLNRVFRGELWSLSDRYLTRRDRRGESRTTETSWPEVAAIFQVPMDVLIRAWQTTPHARLSAQLKRGVRRLAQESLDQLRSRVAFFP